MLKSFDLLDKHDESVLRFRKDYMDEFMKHIHVPGDLIEKGQMGGRVQFNKNFFIPSGSDILSDAWKVLVGTYEELGFELELRHIASDGFAWLAKRIKGL